MLHKEPEPQKADRENTPNYSTDIGDEVRKRLWIFCYHNLFKEGKIQHMKI